MNGGDDVTALAYDDHYGEDNDYNDDIDIDMMITVTIIIFIDEMVWWWCRW